MIRKKLVISLLCALGSFLFLRFVFTAPADLLQRKLSDSLFSFTIDSSPDDTGHTGETMTIVAIDEQTLRHNPYQAWPWKREHYADLIRRIARFKPSSIVLTMVFDQPGTPAGDDALARALEETGNVLLSGYLTSSEESAGSVIYVSPLPKFSERASGHGFANAVYDSDGVVRKTLLKLNSASKDDPHVSLTLLAICHYNGLSLEGVRFEPTSIRVSGSTSRRGVNISPEPEQNPEEVIMRINYRGGLDRFSSVSFKDVYNETADPVLLKDRIVLVGITLPGEHETFSVPLGVKDRLTSVELMANVLDTAMRGRCLTSLKPWQSTVYTLIAVILGSLAFFLLWPGVTWIVLLLLVLTLWSLPVYFFTRFIILPIGAPLLNCSLLFLMSLLYHYTGERRRREVTARAFKHYVSPDVVQKILSSGDDIGLGGEKRTLTILFSDIAGFTTVSESMEPESLVELLNEYLSAMSAVILEEHGTIDKYIGDAIVAFWNAPMDQPDHAARACRAALAMQERLGVLNNEWETRGLPRLDTRIGINTGEVIVGNIGSSERFDYTVIGDDVNLASRLEGINKYYGSSIIISFATFLQGVTEFDTRELDYIKVKGKNEPVSILELVGSKDTIPKDRLELARRFGDVLASYRMGEWDEAVTGFSALHERFPDDQATAVFLQRARKLKENPPEKWDGVYLFDKK